MKILLAEDEKDMSSALTAILQHSGYDVDSVYDGQSAMEKALANVYDCLIFDIMMPKMSGIEALKIIRQKGNLSPVIMLTAKSEIDDRITGLDAGADDYLMKPFSVWRVIGSYTFFNSQKYSIFTTYFICRFCSFKYRRANINLQKLYKLKS